MSYVIQYKAGGMSVRLLASMKRVADHIGNAERIGAQDHEVYRGAERLRWEICPAAHEVRLYDESGNLVNSATYEDH